MSQTVGVVQIYSPVPPSKPNVGKSSTKDASLAEMFSSAGLQVLSLASDFSVPSSTTLVLVTGLSGNLVAGKKYNFEVVLFTDSDVSAGIKLSLEGTAVLSSIIAEAICFDSGIANQARVTALSTNAVAITPVTNGYVTVSGSLVCTTSGTFKIHFAQNVSNAIASKVIAGSSLKIQQIT